MEIRTACTLDCPDRCSLVVRKEGGRPRIGGSREHPLTAGFACVKIKRHLKRLSSRDRLVDPLLRTKGGWHRIGWPEALDRCAAEVDRLRDNPQAILHLAGGGDKGVLHLLGRLLFGLLGASATQGNLCNAAGVAAMEADFGSLAHNAIHLLLESGRIVLWGKDLRRSSPHLARVVQRAGRLGAEVLGITPGGCDYDRLTGRVIRVRPGTDRFLAAAGLRRLLEEGSIPAGIIKATANFETFRELIMRSPVQELASRAGVGQKEVEELVSFYQGPGPTATLIGWGLQRYLYGGQNVRFINALALLSGQVGRPGGGSGLIINYSRNLNLAWSRAPGEDRRRRLRLPLLGQDLDSACPPVEFIWINGVNIANQAAGGPLISQSLARVPFKVVVEAFMTDTAALADLILPCALLLEKEDLTADKCLDDSIHYVQPVFRPPGRAKPDHWIYTELGRRLSPSVELPPAEECFKKSLDLPCLDAGLEELRRKGTILARRPEVAFQGLVFDHPDGKYRLPEKLDQEPPPPPGFPLRLLTLVRGGYLHSQIPPEDQESPPKAWISPREPSLAGLDLERPVRLVTGLGRARINLIADPGLQTGLVLTRRGGWQSLGAGLNQLIEPRLTDLGHGAALYHQYARLEQDLD